MPVLCRLPYGFPGPLTYLVVISNPSIITAVSQAPKDNSGCPCTDKELQQEQLCIMMAEDEHMEKIIGDGE